MLYDKRGVSTQLHPTAAAASERTCGCHLMQSVAGCVQVPLPDEARQQAGLGASRQLLAMLHWGYLLLGGAHVGFVP